MTASESRATGADEFAREVAVSPKEDQETNVDIDQVDRNFFLVTSGVNPGQRCSLQQPMHAFAL